MPVKPSTNNAPCSEAVSGKAFSAFHSGQFAGIAIHSDASPANVRGFHPAAASTATTGVAVPVLRCRELEKGQAMAQIVDRAQEKKAAPERCRLSVLQHGPWLLEDAFDPVRPRLRIRRMPFAALAKRFVDFLQQLALMLGQLDRRFDADMAVQVAGVA